MALYNNGADVPSPQEASNGFPQPGASGTWHKGEEEVRLVEPSMVKKAHREILDHERKRRVELKCMELQEMMEEQGYSEEEIRQKVGTFRQMLMEKEGVLTREDQHGRQIVIENHHGADGEEYEVEYPAYGEGCLLQCDCSAECYREDSGHREYRSACLWGPAGHGVPIQGHRGQGPIPSSFPSLACCPPQVEKTLEQLHLSSTQEEKEEEIRSPPEPVSPQLSLCCPLSLEGSSPPSSALCQALEEQVTPLLGAVHP
uniref:Uncharacterized protein n=1 Tax=Geospiza parvula TaxID=87175 RepID=A0A8C3Q760_GEOPR